ncbi:MAG: FG-GAP-like repeat-containing protein [Caldilineaceae bacterium]
MDRYTSPRHKIYRTSTKKQLTILSLTGVLVTALFATESLSAASLVMTKVASLGSAFSAGVELGDLDGDGDLDAFVANSFGEANTVWLNNGNGSFSDSGQRLGNAYSWAVALGDIDGDGDLDAVVANGDQPSEVWFNDGAGQFHDKGVRVEAIGGSTLALGDLDGDGDLDVFLGINQPQASNEPQGNQVWLNTGGIQGGEIGTFTNTNQLLGDFSSYSIVLGDLDGDGDLDAFEANNGNQADRVWLNDGKANFTDSGQALGNLPSAEAVLGDLDGDGDLDAYVVNFLTPDKVWLNDGHGIFSDSGQSLDTSAAEGVTLGDIDGDGDLDAFIANRRRMANQIWLNNGNAIFSDSGLRLGDSDSYAVALGDLDKDGDLDVYVANGASEGDTIWRNDSPINFVNTGQTLGDSESWATALGDVDSDGDLDAFIGNFWNQPNQVWLNDGNAQFTDSGQRLGQTATTAVSLGDLDGDHDLDAFVANHGPNQVWINDGQGVFTDSGQTLGNANSEAVALGDVDGDGDLDAFVGNGGRLDQVAEGLPDTVWLNDGQGNFALHATIGNANTEHIALGDLDSDGDLDAFLANSWNGISNQNDVWQNDGQGNFAKLTSFGDNDSYGVELGDLDGDGDLDAFVVNIGGQANIAWLNDGHGFFTQSDGLGSSSSYAVALGDLDGDGDLDAFVANAVRRVNKIWRNDGLAHFTEVGSFGDSDSVSVALGDLDQDGDPDAFIGNCCTNRANRVWRNDSGGATFHVAVDKPGPTQTANFHASPVVLEERIISIPYHVYQAQGQAIGRVAAYYSLNGGEHWQPAIAATDTVTANLATYGSALQFDGTDDYVALPAMEVNFSTGFTVEAWARYNEFHRWSRIIDLGNGAGRDNILFANRDFSNDLVFEIHTDSGASTLTAVNALDVDTWIHLAATIDSQGNAKLYKNGVEIASGVMPLPTTIRRATNYLGRSNWSQDGYLHGALDEVRIWQVARSTEQIRATMLQNLTSSEEGLVTYWQFNEGAGLVIKDLVSGQTGILGGGTAQQQPGWDQHLASYRYHWDTFASGIFGQTDNAVFRLEIYPQPLHTHTSNSYTYINTAAHSLQWPSAASITFPFRLRGTQVLVLDDQQQPASGVIVYRLPNGQQINGDVMGGDQTPFTTSPQGYLSGRGILQFDDQLIALAPIHKAEKYTLYHTSAPVSVAGLAPYVVRTAGVQPLTVSAANPLLLFNLTVSLEWDASNDPIFLPQLRENLRRAAEALYDWTNGQVALGKITVYQAKEHWQDADIQILASNQVRPIAHRGGVVAATTIITLSHGVTMTALPGNIRMGPTWNRYGNAEFIPGDWPNALAHELGHYLLYLEDTYLGLDPERNLLIPIATCRGTAMTDPYDDSFSEFRFGDETWENECGRSLAEMAEWEVMTQIYTALRKPMATLTGPILMPFAFTQVDVKEPPTDPTTFLDDINIQLDDPTGKLSGGRVYLIRAGIRIIDLGRPLGNAVIARGAKEGDELCVFAPTAFACGFLSNRNTLRLTPRPPKQLQILLLPGSAHTLQLLAYDVGNGPMTATVYPDGNAPLTVTLQSGVAVTVTWPLTTTDVLVDLRGDHETKRNVTGYLTGSGPARTRSHGGPFTTGDGGASIFPPQNLAADDFVVMQTATVLPTFPAGLRQIGRAYEIRSSSVQTTFEKSSITFQYLGLDLLLSEKPENTIAIYYWDGLSWTRLDTVHNITQNFASAPLPAPGLYGLAAGTVTAVMTDVTPGWAYTGAAHTLTIHGENFLPPIAVTMTGDSGAYPLAVSSVSTQMVTVTTPLDLPADLYDLALVHPGSEPITQTAAFALYTASPAQVCFFDDFQSGLGQWHIEGEWNTILLNNGGEAVTDSPDHPYRSADPGTTLTTALTSQPFDLSNCGQPVLTLRHDYEVLADDWLTVEFSADDGITWSAVLTYTADQVQASAVAVDDEWPIVQWQVVRRNLTELGIPADSTPIRLRLRLTANDIASARGWLIDQLVVSNGDFSGLPPENQSLHQLFLPLVSLSDATEVVTTDESVRRDTQVPVPSAQRSSKGFLPLIRQ